jgi:hypothetical protein
VHPGGIVTGLAKFMLPEEMEAFRARRGQGFKNPEPGAATTVWCAVSEQLNNVGGVYCEDCNVAAPVPASSEELRGVRPWATDAAAAEKLWALSEKITGVTIG